MSDTYLGRRVLCVCKIYVLYKYFFLFKDKNSKENIAIYKIIIIIIIIIKNKINQSGTMQHRYKITIVFTRSIIFIFFLIIT